MISISCGALDEMTNMKLVSHIFTADKGEYYDILDGLPLHVAGIQDTPHMPTIKESRPQPSNQRRVSESRKGMDFNTIDVETANRDFASICQIGIVQVRRGQVVNCWKSLVDPQDDFDPFNVRIHGIDENMVRGSPLLPDLLSDLKQMLIGTYTVSHTSFDRKALDRALLLYQCESLPIFWLDSVKIARHAWPGRQTYKLSALAAGFGIAFRHHDALEDARVVAELMIMACSDTGYDMPSWHKILGSTSPLNHGNSAEA